MGLHYNTFYLISGYFITDFCCISLKLTCLLNFDLIVSGVVPEIVVDVEPAARLRVSDLDEQRQHLRPLLGLHGVLHGHLRHDWQKVREGFIQPRGA